MLYPEVSEKMRYRLLVNILRKSRKERERVIKSSIRHKESDDKSKKRHLLNAKRRGVKISDCRYVSCI